MLTRRVQQDALIEDLESQDGHDAEEDEEESPHGGRVVPEDMLQTDTRQGLTEAEVIARRRKASRGLFTPLSAPALT